MKGVLRIVGGVMSVGLVLLLGVAGVILLVALVLLLAAHWLGG
jgi:hypothetical protein